MQRAGSIGDSCLLHRGLGPLSAISGVDNGGSRTYCRRVVSNRGDSMINKEDKVFEMFAVIFFFTDNIYFIIQRTCSLRLPS
jgi:hypothetical protein